MSGAPWHLDAPANDVGQVDLFRVVQASTPVVLDATVQLTEAEVYDEEVCMFWLTHDALFRLVGPGARS